MKLSNTEYGKAFEFSCLVALFDYLKIHSNGLVHVQESDAYRTAKMAFRKADDQSIADDMKRAANAAVRALMRLEPELVYGKDTLVLSIQNDAQGIAGDVRDVLCIRGSDQWQIGLSCKHNHHAVKHSRLSATIDFGKEWLGIPCSKKYFDTVVPIFHELRKMKIEAEEKGEAIPLWRDVPDKAERFYVPVLEAFMEEMKRLEGMDDSVPEKLLKYLLGRHDFYKVITNDKKRTTRVEAINIMGSLNKSVGIHSATVDVGRLRMPTRFYHIDLAKGSNNRVEIVCDEGWALSMRIHSASSHVEPSLKFDVQLEALPPSLHAQIESW